MSLDQRVHDPALENYGRKNSKTTRRSDNGFDKLGIAPLLLKATNRLHFEHPTPIQEKAIPAGIQGDDIIAIAQTGSGKTLAFGLPMLQRLSKIKRGTGLVVVPTRELAIQVEEALQTIGHAIHMRSVVLIGGASLSMQRMALKKNPRIVIATPGRLLDHIERRNVSLSRVEVFILDEADRMLDMGFVPDIKKIMKSIPDNRQTMLFSATMPKEIEAIARELMKAPTRIEIDRSGATPAEVSHEMFFVKNQDKGRLLALRLKQCTGPVLVFTRTKRMASRLTEKVNKMGFVAAEIHSNRSQGQRRNALEGFKRGRFQVLIATDIAARGIDVSGIELVVNYDMPANSEDYVHRIGRTGRAGKTGHAISFATNDQRRSIQSLERFMKTKLAISAVPTLPSEKLLIKEAEQLHLRCEPARVATLARRKPFGDRSPRRQDFKRSNSRKHTFRRPESGQGDYKAQGTSWQKSKSKVSTRSGSPSADISHTDSNGDFKKRILKQIESKPNEAKRKDSSRQKSKRKVSKGKSSKRADSKPESAFWSNFKKHRPAKKKSTGQGSRRKRRAKQK